MFENIYPDINIATLRNIISTDKSTDQIITGLSFIKVERSTIIESYYYRNSNMTEINETINILYDKMNLIYNNDDSTLLISRNYVK